MTERSNDPPRCLLGWRAWGYSSGVLGQLLPVTLVNAYIFMFYVYTIGLDPLLVSIGTALAAVLNGIGSPLFGAASDNARLTKLGKRKPFMLAGIALVTVTVVLLWLSPFLCPVEGCKDATVTLYLWVLLLAFYLGFTCMRSPYLSMLPEISRDEKNRISISGKQGMFSIVATVLGVLLPVILQSQLDDPKQAFHETADGQYLLATLPVIALAFAIMAVVFTAWAFISVDEKFHGHADTSKVSIKQMFVDIFRPFKDKECGKFLASSFLTNTSMRMITKILAPLLTYVLLLQGMEFNVYIFLLLPFVGVGFVIWQKRAKKGLKPAFVQSTYLIAIALAATFVFVFEMDKYARIGVSFVIVGAILLCLVTGYILPNPILAKLVDLVPEEPACKKNISGSYYGAFLFMLNMANAIGDIIIGFLLTEGNQTNPLFITLILPISSLLYFVAAWVFSRSKL